MIPAATLAAIPRFATAAHAKPAASEAIRPSARREIIIGRVNAKVGSAAEYPESVALSTKFRTVAVRNHVKIAATTARMDRNIGTILLSLYKLDHRKKVT